MVCLLLVLLTLIGASEAGYKALNLTRTADSITGMLVSDDEGAISPLFLNIALETGARIRIRITDPNEARYEVPYPEPATYKQGNKSGGLYTVYVKDAPFTIKIIRVSDGTAVFDTSSHDLIYRAQFLSFGTILPSAVLYGIGEDAAPLLRDLKNRKHSLWNSGGYYEQGQGINLYGSHPFYLNLEAGGAANGLLLMNSNAMDILLTEKPSPTVTWNTIGGVLDFSVFVGTDPVDVIRRYTERIGRPFLPPIWSLGFQLCRWGYNNTNYMSSVMEDMVLQNVPVDVQWNDIDYMDKYKDFTVSQERYKDLPDYVEYLHSLGKRYVVMMDPALFAELDKSYEPTDSGISQDVFIRNSSGQFLVGNVWPGDTFFPDFLDSGTKDWWSTLLSQFYNTKLNFDGVWIDMNEPQSFYDGSQEGCPWEDKLENPPYYPGVRHKLQWGTLCLTAKQHQYLHYDVHNLYAWSEAQATYGALKSIRPTNRTFILTRSTFVGSGRWAAHWTGDVSSSWSDLAASIPGLINMNMFGIPLAGADICGFNGDSNKELCIRWSQLGAFYPFSRNHNTLFGAPQEPTAWGTETTAIIRAALLQRYRLMLYLYSLFEHSHTSGDPVMQGLFMQFPRDTATYDKDRQFMWGSAIMICPTIEEGAVTTWIYFPDALWYDLWSVEKVSNGSEVMEHFPSPLDKINVFARGGSVIPIVLENKHVTPTAESVLYTKTISLYCYLDKDGSAWGELFIDDGYADDSKRPVHRAVFAVSNRQLKVTPVTIGSGEYVRVIANLMIGGVVGDVVGVYVNDTLQTGARYYKEKELLIVDQLVLPGDKVSTDKTIIVRWPSKKEEEEEEDL